MKVRSLRCCCLGTLINPEISALSSGVLIIDQVLLMASVIMVYMAGVVPSKKFHFTSRKSVSDDVVPDESTSSGR